MSLSKEVDITCPECKNQSKFTIWESINFQLNPELKEKFFSGELHLFKCPSCGNVTKVMYTTLLHDMEKGTMTIYSPQQK